jgi:hypothetical protein
LFFKRKNMTGQRFGRFVVQSFNEVKGKGQTYWNCLCDCGNIKSVNGSKLRSGDIKSCGCLAKEIAKEVGRNLGNSLRENLIGKKFNRLTILSFAGSSGGNGVKWNCLCECGKTTVVRSQCLKENKTKSCGCLQKENRHKRIEELTGKIFGKLTVLHLDSKRDSDGSVKWICQCECGKKKSVNKKSLRSGRTLSCGCEKFSVLENAIENILINASIMFEKQHKLHGSRQKLDFLIYYKDKHVGIECQGIQHYENIKFFGGETGLNSRKSRDNKKKEHLEKLNIPLIEIPYWEKDIETFLFAQLERISL